MDFICFSNKTKISIAAVTVYPMRNDFAEYFMISYTQPSECLQKIVLPEVKFSPNFWRIVSINLSKLYEGF